jgi:biotin-dependent carboxylase-like uncharacterized protein
MLIVAKPGLQTTLQGAPRLGHRHFGLPYAGPADPLSHALANRLVGNALTATALEITYGGFAADLEAPSSLAVTGAHGEIRVSGQDVHAHTTLHVKAGDRIEIMPPEHGMRAYLAVHSGFQADSAFDSSSTYLPAQIGGMEGRALTTGDRLEPIGPATLSSTFQTPQAFRPSFSNAIALRACPSAETHLLNKQDLETLFNETFIAGRQATRMGVAMTGHTLAPNSDGKMKSAPVFPGTIQCPPSGTPVLLLCDAQTTGGYPRVASIARCDQHLLGQIRPGDRIQLLERSPDAALHDFAEKQKVLSAWLEA